MFVISPILNRELLTFLRRKRAFIGLLIYLLILAATAGIVWWQGSETEQSVRARDFISRTLFHSITIAQLLIFSAYSLILTSTKINSERDEKTLDLLITAPLSSLHIVLAKYFSALAVILLLIIASAPFLSLTFLLGGLSGREVVSAYAIVLAAVLAYGMIGLACSALCRRNYVALATAFVIAMAFYGGLALLSALVINALDRWGNFLGAYENLTILFAFCIPSPLGAYTDLMFGPPPSFGTPIATFVSNNILYVHLAFEALVLLVFFAVAWRRFRLIIAPDKPVRTVRRTFFMGRLVPVNPAPNPAPEAGPASNRAAGASRSGWLRRGPRPIADGVNPVFAREDRMLFSRRLRYRLLRLAIAAAILLISAAMFWEPGQENNNNKFSDYMAPLGIWTAFLVAFFAPMLAARAVTSERETHCLPLLAVSTLRPFEILWGKFAVLLKHVCRAVALFTFVVLFMLPRPPGGYPILLTDWTKILLPLLSMSVFYLSIGLFCSTLFRKTVTAVIASYGVAAAGIAILVLALIYNAVTGADMDNVRVAMPFLLPPLFFAGETTSFFDPAKWFSIAHYCVDLLVASAALFAFAVARFAELTGARVTSRGRGAEI
jgi:ABC-type transport system involved in multi-copper enzyme maturation permease subunit